MFAPAKKRALAILAICLASFAARADLWVTGYYPGYATSRMAASNIDFSVVTHVIHFSLIPTNGSVNSSANDLTASACTNLVHLAHAAGRKALICVGGAGTEADFLSATTSANLPSFVSSISNFMSTYSYDGVDIDWEPFASTDTNQYTNLVIALRAAIGTNKLLTVAASPYPGPQLDSPTPEYAMFAAVQSQFDQINLMTYDLSGAYEGWVTWYNSPIYDGGYKFPGTSELVPSIRGAVSNFVSAGVVPAKLGIGTPFYGYIWTGGPGMTGPRQSWPSTNVPTTSTPTYADIITSNYQSSLYHWDSVADAPYLSITNVPASNDMFISYDDTNSTAAKVSYARNLGLGGVMLWELTQDYISSQPVGQRTPLTSALKQALATPQITGIQWNGANFGFSFTSAPLGLYRVLCSSNAAGTQWNTLTNNVSGTGSNVLITDPNPATNTAQYYRVQTPP